MTDKPFDKLNVLDQTLRRTFPVKGFCENHTKVTIEFVNGFELFNTRPYHNYESWSDGYRITDGVVKVEAEDLDDAVDKFVAAVAAYRCGEAKPWQLVKPDRPATPRLPDQGDGG